MARNKKLDKLSQDMIQCKKDGFGVHYGRWKATQEAVVPVKAAEETFPDHWPKCDCCGKPYDRGRKNQRFCSGLCREKYYREVNRERLIQYARDYRAAHKT